MIEEINNDMEHVEKQNITNELIQDTLKNCDKSVNTKKSYTSSIKKMLQQYNECDYNVLFYNENKNFVKIIENMSKNPSTQKSYYNALIFLLREFNIDVEYFSDIIKNLNLKTTIEQDAKMKKEVLDLSLTDKMIDALNVELNDNGLYDNNTQMYVMAYMIKNYGVLRPDEWRTIYISDSDNNVPDNYINVETRKLYIKNHKTKSSLGTREYELDEHIYALF